MFFFPCLNVIEYLRYSCDWSCYVNNNRYWTLGDWLLSWLTGCGYSSLCTPGHMVGWALPKLPKSRVCWSQDLSYHYGGPCRPRPCRKLHDQWKKPSKSIYLSTYLYMSTKTGIYTEYRQQGEGRGGWDNQDVHAKFAKTLLIIYLSFQIDIKSAILFKFLFLKPLRNFTIQKRSLKTF